jgi:hypothetical protein
LTNGTIISINKQGDGSVVSPTAGAFAGIYAKLEMIQVKFSVYASWSGCLE